MSTWKPSPGLVYFLELVNMITQPQPLRCTVLFSNFSFLFHLKNHYSKDVNFKFHLKRSSCLDVRSNSVCCSCSCLLCKLFMVTITRHVFTNIFQTDHFPAVTFSMGYEKNMSFFVIAKSPKVWKRLKRLDWASLTASLATYSPKDSFKILLLTWKSPFNGFHCYFIWASVYTFCAYTDS